MWLQALLADLELYLLGMRGTRAVTCHSHSAVAASFMSQVFSVINEVALISH